MLPKKISIWNIFFGLVTALFIILFAFLFLGFTEKSADGNWALLGLAVVLTITMPIYLVLFFIHRLITRRRHLEDKRGGAAMKSGRIHSISRVAVSVLLAFSVLMTFVVIVGIGGHGYGLVIWGVIISMIVAILVLKVF